MDAQDPTELQLKEIRRRLELRQTGRRNLGDTVEIRDFSYLLRQLELTELVAANLLGNLQKHRYDKVGELGRRLKLIRDMALKLAFPENAKRERGVAAIEKAFFPVNKRVNEIP